ncbi:hypothetical protein Gasu2_05390 [Galdieria sulphuraria]|nr:hypothetical protein Gasu2_05390 [Galdieria sulphuraria]
MAEKGLEEKSNSRQERKELALKQNIHVLSRYFSGIRSILFYAHNVCVYDFDEANKCWKRSEIEGAFHIVDTFTEIPFRIIVLNRRELENLALDIVPGKIYALWFFDEEEKVEAVKVLSLLLEQQRPAPENLSLNQRLYGSYSKTSEASLVHQTPEKEILRLLKSSCRSNEVTTNGAENSPPTQRYRQVLSPGRLGSPFPLNNNVMKNMSKPNFTNRVETSQDSVTIPCSVEAGKQILSLLKHVESSSLSETSVVNDPYASVGNNSSRNSSFNANFGGHEQTQSDSMKDNSFPPLQAALQVLAYHSSGHEERLKRPEIDDKVSEIAAFFERFGWKSTLPSEEQLKELLNAILHDDVLFHQFYEQYIRTVKSTNAGAQYSSIP